MTKEDELNNIFKLLESIIKGWTKEHRFDSTRRFSFDFAHLGLKTAIEIEGGIWTKGHTNPKTYIKDMQKYNLAQLKGWIVLRYGYGQENDIERDVKFLIEKR